MPFSAGLGRGLQPFTRRAANEVSKPQKQGEGSLTSTQETELWRVGSTVGQITSDIKPQNRVVGLSGDSERSDAPMLNLKTKKIYTALW